MLKIWCKINDSGGGSRNTGLLQRILCYFHPDTMKNRHFLVGLPPSMASKPCTKRLMLPFRRTFICLGVLALLAIAIPAHAQTAYVSKYRPLADSLSAVYGIPRSVILGVAIIESGAGNTRNARLLNNHFGIVGSNRLHKTHGIRTRYKQYPSVAASYVAFCQLVSRRKFYPKLKGEKDYRKWVDAISRTGYSERPAEWRKKIIGAIQKNKLAN